MNPSTPWPVQMNGAKHFVSLMDVSASQMSGNVSKDHVSMGCALGVRSEDDIPTCRSDFRLQGRDGGNRGGVAVWGYNPASEEGGKL